VRVPKYILAYNNIPFEQSEETVSVKDALKKRFNYDEMMRTWLL